jgi:hypothetical protein
VRSLDVPLLEEIWCSELRCDHGSHDLAAPFFSILGWAILSYVPGSLDGRKLVWLPTVWVESVCRSVVWLNCLDRVGKVR